MANTLDPGTTPDLLRTGFSVRSERSGSAVVLRLHGDLDMATAIELRSALTLALEAQPAALALDLTNLAFIDSSGIGVLVGLNRRAQEAGCSLVLRSPSRSVLKALRLTGVDQLLVIDGPPLS